MSQPWNSEVFLSFSGEDVRKGFLGHLYEALVRVGIKTFKDDEGLKIGEMISGQLREAIQDSRISVVVFSKGYASSGWCLNELVEINKCRKTRGQLVFPVFIDVDPSHVRKQEGSFKDAFDKHARSEDMKTVKGWRKALEKVGNLPGLVLENVESGDESELVRKIVAKVIPLLPVPLTVAMHPVGIDDRVEELTSLLHVQSDNVLMIGIHGMGGIGKTTVAKALYNIVFHQFEGSCFLENVSEASKLPNGLASLQATLLGKVSNTENPRINGPSEGSTMIKQRLQNKKVLVIVDDADDPKQLQALVGNRDWFGSGSRILVTTRNAQLLDSHRVNEKYEMKVLDDDQSVELFRWHAFGEGTPSDEYEEVSRPIIKKAGGLPLALEVLGSLLVGANVSEWQSFAIKLRKIPNGEIDRVLKLSFDALDREEREIFLDIACFFVGRDKGEVSRRLEACGFFGEVGIRILMKRHLLTVDEDNELQMHDLLQDMGRGIVHEESPDDPEGRSRLWNFKDVCNVLENEQGTETIKAIQLHNSDICFSTQAFARMNKLRYLEMNGVELNGSFELLPRHIRWLSWDNCNLECIPPDFHLENLVGLTMVYARLKHVWHGKRVLKSLRFLVLSGSMSLATTPDFSRLPSLEYLLLIGCHSLKEMHPSIGLLKSLVHLDCSFCVNLRELPSSICLLTALRYLDLKDCRSIRGLPEDLGKMQALTYLCVDHLKISQLPFTFGHLTNLQYFSAHGCIWEKPRGLLPTSITGLGSLKFLEILECDLEDIPSEIGSLSLLKSLNLANNNIQGLPSTLSKLSQLEELDVSECKYLESLPPQLPPNLLSLDLNGCKAIKGLNISSATKLRKLDVYGCEGFVMIEGLENLRDIESIRMEGCHSLIVRLFTESFFKGLSTEKNLNISIPTSKAPDWLSHKASGLSATFTVPLDRRHNFLGLILRADRVSFEPPLFLFEDKTNNVRWSHGILGKLCLSFLPEKLLRSKIKGGETIEVSFKPPIKDFFDREGQWWYHLLYDTAKPKRSSRYWGNNELHHALIERED